MSSIVNECSPRADGQPVAVKGEARSWPGSSTTRSSSTAFNSFVAMAEDGVRFGPNGSALLRALNFPSNFFGNFNVLGVVLVFHRVSSSEQE